MKGLFKLHVLVNANGYVHTSNLATWESSWRLVGSYPGNGIQLIGYTGRQELNQLQCSREVQGDLWGNTSFSLLLITFIISKTVRLFQQRKDRKSLGPPSKTLRKVEAVRPFVRSQKKQVRRAKSRTQHPSIEGA